MKNRIIALVVGIVLLLFSILSAHVPDTLWTRTYGTEEYGEVVHSVKQVSDGGFILTGSAHGDLLLLRTRQNGDSIWAKKFGPSNWTEKGYSVIQTLDNGYIATGSSSYYDQYWPYHETHAIYVVKTNDRGILLWSKKYAEEGLQADYSVSGKAVEEIAFNEYVIIGHHFSTFYIFKIDSSGNEIWTKEYWGYGKGRTGQQTLDGGFVIAGSIGDITLMKTNAIGDSVWTKIHGGIESERAYSVKQTSDGGYIIAGYVNTSPGIIDILLIKVDQFGDSIWAQTYHYGDQSIAWSVHQTYDGGFIIGGETKPLGADGKDVYLLRTNSLGDSLWATSYGGSANDGAYSVQQTKDGGYIIGGWTLSFGSGHYDAWLIKLNSIKLISPNGGEVFAPETTITIAWSCEKNPYVTAYRLLFFANESNIPIDTIATDISADSTSWRWNIPHINSADCRIEIQSLDSIGSIIGTDESDSNFTVGQIGTKETFRVYPNNPHMRFYASPNPFTLMTRLEVLSISKDQNAHLQIYDVSGRLVKSIKLTTSTYQLGADLVPGVYFLKLTIGEHKETQKLIKIR